MRDSEKIAIAAHLHVLLRRKTGRVTDTEWMAKDHTYATEIIRFARAQADTPDKADLLAWADKLEAALWGDPVASPAAQASKPTSSAPPGADSAPPPSARSATPVQPPAAAPAPSRYVWGIR